MKLKHNWTLNVLNKYATGKKTIISSSKRKEAFGLKLVSPQIYGGTSKSFLFVQM